MKSCSRVVPLVMVAVAAVLAGCAVFGIRESGTLPRNWWTKDIGEVENYYRARATGVEKKVKIFIAQDDSSLNIDMNTALANARLNAATQLSAYLSEKVTQVRQRATHIALIEGAVDERKMENNDAETIKRRVDECLADYSAGVTSTQFSSFRQIGRHVEKQEGRYVGYVCHSMTDQILEETRKIQDEAFKTLLAETQEYKEIMQEIMEEIAKSMKENITGEMVL